MNDSMLVPDGWEEIKLDNYLDILSGFPFKSEAFTDDPSCIGLIRIRDLITTRTETFYNGEYSDDFVMKKGDVLVGMDGDFHIVKWSNQNALLNQRICRVKSNGSNLDTDFIYYTLNAELVEIHAKTGATTVKHLSVKDIRNISKPLPPLPEQKKIASILTSVDNVIEATEAQIIKLQDLKKAMMTQLLTKGIGHTEFKDSIFGKIPKSWEVKTLQEITQLIKPGPFGSSITKSMYVESGYKVYGQEQVIAGNLSIGNYYIDKNKYIELSSFKIKSKDVLVSLVGTFGEVLVVTDTFEEGIINPRLLILRFDDSLINQQFVKFQLLSSMVSNQLKMFQQGGTMGVLSAGTVKPVKVTVPPLHEQEKIACVLRCLEAKIETKQQKISQTKALKKALMNDLLTGKKRVKVN